MLAAELLTLSRLWGAKREDALVALCRQKPDSTEQGSSCRDCEGDEIEPSLDRFIDIAETWFVISRNDEFKGR